MKEQSYSDADVLHQEGTVKVEVTAVEGAEKNHGQVEVQVGGKLPPTGQ